MPRETTVERQGKMSVSMHTTAHKKACFTVVLAAMANGKKLNLFVILKGFLCCSGTCQCSWVVIALTHNGWMNEYLRKKWVSVGPVEFQEVAFGMGHLKGHIMDSIRREVTMNQL